MREEWTERQKLSFWIMWIAFAEILIFALIDRLINKL